MSRKPRKDPIKVNIGNGLLKVIFPEVFQGKIRLKRKENLNSIGKHLPSSHIDLKDTSQYVEWQITYNIEQKNTGKVNSDLLIDCNYEDLKKTIRKPYELSGVLLLLHKTGLVTKEIIEELSSEIKEYKEFLDSFEIQISPGSSKIVNKINFTFCNWNVPLFILQNHDETYIEVLKEKQQYAAGIQPMIYFCIPCRTLKKENSGFSYEINPSNTNSIINLFRVFGCSSERHKHDIVEVLKCILKLIQERPTKT